MTTLKELMTRVDALKKDLEELGVDVTVSAIGVSRGGMKKPSVTVVSIIMQELEDLEGEG